MSFNYLLFMTSLMRNGCSEISYTTPDLSESYTELQTNVPATKYVISKLSASGEKLTKIIMLCSDEVLKEPITPAGYTAPLCTYDYYTKTVSEWLVHYGYSQEEIDHIFVPFELAGINPGNRKQMSDLITTIQTEISGSTSERNLYLDYTGGMRSASMLLLFFARVMEKDGVAVRQVLYSNISGGENRKLSGIIEDCMATYSLFDWLDALADAKHDDWSRVQAFAKKEGRHSIEVYAEETQITGKKNIAQQYKEISEEEKAAVTISSDMDFLDQMAAKEINDKRKSFGREKALAEQLKKGNAKGAAEYIRNNGLRDLVEKGVIVWKGEWKEKWMEDQKGKRERVSDAF